LQALLPFALFPNKKSKKILVEQISEKEIEKIRIIK